MTLSPMERRLRVGSVHTPRSGDREVQGERVGLCVSGEVRRWILTGAHVYGPPDHLLEGPRVLLPAAGLHLTPVGLGEELQRLVHTERHTHTHTPVREGRGLGSRDGRYDRCHTRAKEHKVKKRAPVRD